MQKLFEIAVVPRIKGTEKLYFRKFDNGILYDTFFNMIPLKKIRQYTLITRLYFDSDVEIYSENGFIKSGNTISLSNISDDEILYLKSSGNSPEQITVYADGESHMVKICIVICTYKRRKQVTENIGYLLKRLNDNFHIILVDNASEIATDHFNDKRVAVLHNVNNGGSGGFGKGMKKAVKMNCFTHLILMDDDVVTDSIAIQKIIGFLSFLKPEFTDLCIAGSMIYLHEPTMQFESGGYFSDNGLQMGYGYHYDLTNFDKLLKNEKEKQINYGGWWLFAMPIQFAETGYYPAPFFMKYDDVEYALRCKMPIITLNGVGVWHENFRSKYNSVQEYFNARNYLFLMQRINQLFDEKKAYKITRKLLLEKLCRQQYKMADAVLIAYNDFLKGEDQIAKINYEEKLQQLSELNYKMFSDEELQTNFGVRYDCIKLSQNPFRRYMQPLLYGHLVPRFLCRKFTVTDVIADRKEHYFRADTVLHYDRYMHCGYVTQKSLLEFLKYLHKLKIQRKGIMKT